MGTSRKSSTSCRNEGRFKNLAPRELVLLGFSQNGRRGSPKFFDYDFRKKLVRQPADQHWIDQIMRYHEQMKKG